MAQKVIVSLVDDLTGGEADETVRFGLDGHDYEIDLAAKSADKLRKSLAPFLAGARRAGSPKRGRRSPSTGGQSNARQIREWARSNGYDVPAKGRVPATVVAAYQEVHGGCGF